VNELLKSSLTQWLYWVYQFLKYKKRVRVDYLARIQNTEFSHQCWLQDNSRIQNSSMGYGSYLGIETHVNYTDIGRYCSIGPGCKIGLNDHPLGGISHPDFYEKTEPKKVIIGDYVYIGAGIIILEGVKIGDHAVIGAGSVVRSNVRAYWVMAGNPFQKIRKRTIQCEEETLTGC
jgi:acetyltransferase-like isoleucine patch superfamily enzyme